VGVICCEKCEGIRKESNPGYQPVVSSPLHSKYRVTGPLIPSSLAAYNSTSHGVALQRGIRSEKRVVRRFRRCANVIECT